MPYRFVLPNRLIRTVLVVLSLLAAGFVAIQLQSSRAAAESGLTVQVSEAASVYSSEPGTNFGPGAWVGMDASPQTYAFYKFAWSYRLSNYAAILIGAVVPHDDPALGPVEAAPAANMNVVAGRHFTRGLQAFFFALAYLGWFIGPWVLIGSTALVLVIVWRRQFASDALDALAGPETSARSKH